MVLYKTRAALIGKAFVGDKILTARLAKGSQSSSGIVHGRTPRAV
jgi:hypothetical protein